MVLREVRDSTGKDARDAHGAIASTTPPSARAGRGEPSFAPAGIVTLRSSDAGSPGWPFG